MAGCNSIECNSVEYKTDKTPNIYPNLNAVPFSAAPLNDQQQFRLNQINEIKDYFVSSIMKP